MSRKCSICNHNRRQEIERALLRGESHHAVAQQFTISRGAVARHLKHVSTALTQAQEVEEDGKSILRRVGELILQAEQVKARANREGDYRTALAALREMTRLVELQARLTGELHEKHETKIVNLTFDAETARRVTETFLARHPSSRMSLLRTGFRAASIAPRNRSGNSTGFCVISATTPSCSDVTKWMKKLSSA